MNWVVVADNHVSTFQEVGRILCKQNIRLTGFKSGQALLDFLRDNRPDLILLGSVIWDLGGFEAISSIRQLTGSEHPIPILLMADQEDQYLTEQAQEMGASGVIGKPLAANELLPLVMKILGLQKQFRKLPQGPGGQGKTAPVSNTLERIASLLEAHSASADDTWMESEEFADVYRHMLRYLENCQGIVFQVLFTVEMANTVSGLQYREIMEQFKQHLQHELRSNDMVIDSGENQILLLLPEVQESDIGHIIYRIISKWKQSKYGSCTEIASEVRQSKLKDNDEPENSRSRTNWVVVVDDDVTNLKMAGLILSRQHMRVTALKSGRALLEYIKDNKPDLILLDIRMPEMDGFETLRRLKQEIEPGQEIPVIFLTSDENSESEMKGLDLGAMDFIRKPFVPEVLILRVKHIIELVRLQKNLAEEVEIKTQENENLSLRVVQTLAEAIDAKDTYTNGHSGRVAEYACEIARRFGYSRKQQDEIYMAGLLHDVGKIGVPDNVINKPGKLTDEEYAQIKIHPVLGERILKRIHERPKLAVVARWHHERCDGTGYPDGLSGTEIPEEARIIAVADAYDAMTSRRSYRGILPQETVRQEIERGKGTQFDSVFADLMLEIIAEDPDYKLREL